MPQQVVFNTSCHHTALQVPCIPLPHTQILLLYSMFVYYYHYYDYDHDDDYYYYCYYYNYYHNYVQFCLTGQFSRDHSRLGQVL